VTEKTPSDVVAERVKEVRKRRGWNNAALAAECAKAGAAQLTENVLENIEHGRRDKAGRRRRTVSVDELLTLAIALNVAPVHLLVPPDDPDEPYPVVGGVQARRFGVRAWIRGIGPIDPDADPREFGAEVPRGEFYWPTHTDSSGEQIHATQQGPAPQPGTERKQED
jgi:transcriptional regulator with XRE-family HTH domain